MSLIHDALKKVERQRQLGKAPTLDSPRFRRRRRRWPWLLLIVVALGLAGAWMWRAPLLHKARTLVAIVRGNNVAPAAPATAQGAGPGQSAAPVISRANGPLPPGASAKPGIREASGASRHAPDDAAAGAAPDVKTAAAPAGSAAQTRSPPDRSPSGPVMAPGENAPLQSTASNQSASPTGKASQGQVESQAPPMYWELPYAERKDLPEFDITMHVYTPDPHDRFVILNGVRQVQGDTLASGQKLIAINPDSITLEDNGHQFRVPRQGSR